MSLGLISEAAVFWIRVCYDVQEAMRPPVLRMTCTKHNLVVLMCTLHTTLNFVRLPYRFLVEKNCVARRRHVEQAKPIQLLAGQVFT